MKPFIIGDKRFAFDVTNADDLHRLERAFSVLCDAHSALNGGEGTAAEGLSASEQMRAVFRMYHDFFDEIFPGRAAEIIGDAPSVSRAGHAFDRWAAYLRSCVEEEERNERMMRRIYLGEEEDADSDEGSAGGEDL